jgi:hypothetical protein
MNKQRPNATVDEIDEMIDTIQQHMGAFVLDAQNLAILSEYNQRTLNMTRNWLDKYYKYVVKSEALGKGDNFSFTVSIKNHTVDLEDIFGHVIVPPSFNEDGFRLRCIMRFYNQQPSNIVLDISGINFRPKMVHQSFSWFNMIEILDTSFSNLIISNNTMVDIEQYILGQLRKEQHNLSYNGYTDNMFIQCVLKMHLLIKMHCDKTNTLLGSVKTLNELLKIRDDIASIHAHGSRAVSSGIQTYDFVTGDKLKQSLNDYIELATKMVEYLASLKITRLG